MLIGIMSDSHDNLPLIAAAVDLFVRRNVETIIHAGDVVSPFSARKIAAPGLPVIAVYGNNDGERAGLAQSLDIVPAPRRFELAGRKFLLVHNPGAIRTEDLAGIDVAVCGHTHEPMIEPGPPLLINPGETGGWTSGRHGTVVLDSETLNTEVLEF
ncbi:MAG: metallophosphoesterase [Planctomycetes bacterium]|nr:metallophosphoesterase [Planctomycetota bacterium]